MTLASQLNTNLRLHVPYETSMSQLLTSITDEVNLAITNRAIVEQMFSPTATTNTSRQFVYHGGDWRPKRDNYDEEFRNAIQTFQIYDVHNIYKKALAEHATPYVKKERKLPTGAQL
jgi:hypothetical protein